MRALLNLHVALPAPREPQQAQRRAHALGTVVCKRCGPSRQVPNQQCHIQPPARQRRPNIQDACRSRFDEGLYRGEQINRRAPAECGIQKRVFCLELRPSFQLPVKCAQKNGKRSRNAVRCSPKAQRDPRTLEVDHSSPVAAK